MPQLTRRLLGLCLPPVLIWSVDSALTLCGQSEAYWAEGGVRDTDGITSLHHYSASVNEVSPTAHHLLAWHQMAFVAESAAGILVLCSLIMLLPRTLALTTSLAATLGHTWGATTWVSRLQYGFQMCNGLFLVVAATGRKSIGRVAEQRIESTSLGRALQCRRKPKGVQ
jgi:hypothetical protein